MGGKEKQNSSTVADYRRGSTEQVTGLPQTQEQFYTALNNYNSKLQQGGPNPVRTSFGPAFSFTQGMDPVVSGFYSKGLETLNNQAGARDRQLATQLGVGGTGDNSALLATLQAQNKLSSAGAANALIPQAGQMQREYDIARANINNQESQLQLQGDTAYNQAMQNQYNTQLQGQGGLFQTLAQLQQAGAGRQVNEYGSGTTDVNSQKKKGLLSK